METIMPKQTVISCIILSILQSAVWAASPKEAEVIHWWISGSEEAALQVIIDNIENKGYRWIDTPVETSFHAKTAALSRILDDNPPTMMQWHAGVSLENLWQEGILRDINDLALSEHWQKKLPAALWESITVDGNVVAVPVTLHGANWMWANKKIIDKLNISPPDSWDDFLQIAPKIQKAGYIPLALGGQAWQERVVFLCIVLDTGGPDFYRAALVEHDPQALAGPLMVKAFSTFAKLKQFTDAASPGRNWSETTKLIIEGKAAFQVMGDWVKGELFQAGLKHGEEFSCSLSPGSNGNYLLVSDTFAMAKVTNEADRQTQLALAKTIMTPFVQQQFNLIKGAIPPRTDISPTAFDPCAQLAMKTVSIPGKSHPGFNMSNTGILASTISKQIHDFWQNKIDPADAAQSLAKAVAEVDDFSKK